MLLSVGRQLKKQSGGMLSRRMPVKHAPGNRLTPLLRREHGTQGESLSTVLIHAIAARTASTNSSVVALPPRSPVRTLSVTSV